MTEQINTRNGPVHEPTEPKRADMSLGDLFGEMTREMGDLFRKELELAKVEGREEVKRAGMAAGMIGVAGVAALLTLAFVSVALAFVLDEVMHIALAFGIVAAIWAVVAAITISMARARAREIEMLPETTQTLKEDVQWARAQTS